MRRKWTVAAISVVVLAPWIGADPRHEPKLTSGNGYTLKAMLYSRHSGPHNGGGVWGKDWIVVLLKASPPGLQPQISGWFQTPFSDITTGVGIAIASGDNIWFKGGITAGRGKYKTYGAGQLVGSGETTAAHNWAPGRRNAVPVAPPVDKHGIAPPAMVRDVLSGGEPQLDANEDVIWAGDDPVWNVPPVPVLRVTSSVSYQGGAVARYTYTVENLTGVSRTFSFPEITTASFPSGWSGTVPAYDTATVNVDDDPSDTVWEQHSLGTLGESGDPTATVLRTVRVYVPTSRLATEVEVTITSAGYDPIEGANVVHFTLSAPAEGALLYRVTDGDEQTFEIVAEMSGPLASGMPYELEDSAFPPGVNRYSVHAGTGVNGHRSDEIEVGIP